MPEDENKFVAHFKFESEVLSFTEAYDMRRDRHAASQESFDYWNSLSVPYQEALIHLMQMACEVLFKDADSWVPFCLLPYTDSEGAQFVNITSGFLTSDIEAQMDLLVTASEFELEEAKRKLREGMFRDTEELDSDEEFIKECETGIAMGRSFSASEMSRALKLLTP